MIDHMRLLGLTGGIGSGKSTVGRMIRDRDVPVLDADEFARQVVERGTPALAEIAAAWPRVMNPDGTLNRKALAAQIFVDPAARARLQTITHPRIHAAARAAAGALSQSGHPLAFYEASLLVETGRQADFDGLVVVTATEAQQIERTCQRDRCSEEEARRRLDAQLPLAAKVAVATHLIDNSRTMDDTRRQVEALLAQLR